MFDWREFFPIESIAPVLGGIFLWFGINYIYIAPEILAPRLATKYYTPACTKKVTALRTDRAEFEQQRAAQKETILSSISKASKKQLRKRTNSMLGNFFSAYGQQGEDFVKYYGTKRLGNTFLPSQILDAGIDRKINKKREELERKEAQEREALRRDVRHTTVSNFCGCVVNQGLSNRVDLAAYTASLRAYTPGAIKSLEAGDIGSQALICGKPPII